jgi:hypothetical protein
MNTQKDPSHLARLNSICDTGSQRWLQVLPRSPHLRLLDPETRIALRLRLGIPFPATADSDKCFGCGQDDALKKDPWHYLSCCKYISNEGTSRHDSISSAITKHARFAGLYVRHEPKKLDMDSDLRPDIEMFTYPKTTLLDVVVAHSLAPSHQHASAKTPLAAAAKKVTGKCKKYKQLARYRNATFIPVAVETFGGIHGQTKKAARAIANHAILNCSHHSYASIMNELLDEIAIHIQRGNARMFIAGETQRMKSLSV